MKCKSCGAISEGKFCGYCGTPFEEKPEVQAAQVLREGQRASESLTAAGFLLPQVQRELAITQEKLRLANQQYDYKLKQVKAGKLPWWLLVIGGFFLLMGFGVIGKGDASGVIPLVIGMGVIALYILPFVLARRQKKALKLERDKALAQLQARMNELAGRQAELRAKLEQAVTVG